MLLIGVKYNHVQQVQVLEGHADLGHAQHCPAGRCDPRPSVLIDMFVPLSVAHQA